MQVSEFMNGGFVAHKVFLDGMDSKFSIWVSPLGALIDAQRFDRNGKAYGVNHQSRAWARLDGRAQVIAADLVRVKRGGNPVHYAPRQFAIANQGE